ncbi:MAG: hypothetical protein HY608_00875 [Planctomycetes bacterium]|nr:hypothetical protein [Planctomycetota bacterium]
MSLIRKGLLSILLAGSLGAPCLAEGASLTEAEQARLAELRTGLDGRRSADRRTALSANALWENTSPDDLKLLDTLLAPEARLPLEDRAYVETRHAVLRLVALARDLASMEPAVRDTAVRGLVAADVSAIGALAPLVRHPDAVLAERAREVLLQIHYRLEVSATLASVPWSDEVQVAVEGETDLPEGTIVTTRLYAEFEPAPDGSERRAFIEQYYLRAEAGKIRGSMRAHRLAPGRYTFECTVDGRRQYPQVAPLLVLDPEGEIFVGGQAPSCTQVLAYGTDEETLREKEAGQSRVLNNLRRLGPLAEAFFRRQEELAGPESAAEPPADLANLAACRALASDLTGSDVLARQKGRDRLSALDASAEAFLWARAALEGPDRETYRALAAAIHWDWLQQIRQIESFLNVQRADVAGRNPVPEPMYSRFGASGMKGLLLCHALLDQSRRSLEEALPIERPAPSGEEAHMHGGGEGAPALPLTPEAWRETYAQAAIAYADDATSDLLLRSDRIRRELHAAFLAATSIPADAASPWTATEGELRGEIAGLGADLDAASALSGGLFEEAVAGRFGADAPVRGVTAALGTLQGATSAAVRARSEAPFEEARGAYLNAVRRCAGGGDAERSWRVPGWGDVWVDLDKGEVSVPAQICQRGALIELFACTPGSKTHESALIVACQPSQLHAALLMLGLRDGLPPHLRPEENAPRGDFVDIYVAWTGEKEGEEAEVEHRVRAEELIVNVHEEKEMDRRSWVFTGSEFFRDTLPDGTVRDVYGADANGIIITTFYRETAVLHTASQYGYDDTSFQTNPERLPPEGTAVTLRMVPTPRADVETLLRKIRESGESMVVTPEGGQEGRAPSDSPAPPSGETPR